MKQPLKWKWKYLLVIPLVLILSMAVYLNTYQKAMDEAVGTLVSNDTVKYKASPWLEFTPAKGTVEKGLILYPGGKVDAAAYAPLAERIAEAGYKVVVVPMTFHLAVFSPNKADDVIMEYPEIKHWYIGGHSLGGVFAAQYAYQNQDRIDGLVLLASYPQTGSDLSGWKGKVLSIYGTKDAFVKKDRIDASKPLLPKDTVWVEIQGGNHSQMGWYGLQKGDNPAMISREKQQTIIIQSITDLLRLQ